MATTNIVSFNPVPGKPIARRRERANTTTQGNLRTTNAIVAGPSTMKIFSLGSSRS